MLTEKIYKRTLIYVPILAFFIVFSFGNLFINAAGTESGYQLLAPIDTIKAGDTSVGITLVDYMKGLFVAVIGFAIILAVVELVVGGIEYVAAAVPSAKEDAKKRIGGAVGGLLLILIAWILLQALNPKLLSVGLNLREIAIFSSTGVVTQPPPPQWCLFNRKTPPEKIGGPFPDEKTCDDEKPSGLAVDCKLCDGGVPSVSGCEDSTAVQQRVEGGGQVCQTTSCQSCGNKYDTEIQKAIAANGANGIISVSLIEGLIFRESTCGVNMVSTDGACGLMQVLPSSSGYTCSELMDTQTNINAGVKILKNNITSALGNGYSSVTSIQMGLASYNCCENGDNPNSQSVSCDFWSVKVPKWGCPINPGEMCDVKDYACNISACI